MATTLDETEACSYCARLCTRPIFDGGLPFCSERHQERYWLQAMAGDQNLDKDSEPEADPDQNTELPLTLDG